MQQDVVIFKSRDAALVQVLDRSSEMEKGKKAEVAPRCEKK